MDKLCPDCHVTLASQTVFGVELDTCGACAGLWFGPGEIEQVRNSAPEALLQIEQSMLPHPQHAPHITTDRWCPVCPQPLERHDCAADLPIVIDGCPRCGGIWITEQELHNITVCIHNAHKPYRVVGRSPDEMAAELAQIAQEHANFMERQSRIQAAFTMMSQRPLLGLHRRWRNW